MTSIKQRDELQSTIWKIANEVRGAVDGWDFKQFVLGALFIGLSVRTSPTSLKAVTRASTMRICRMTLSPLK